MGRLTLIKEVSVGIIKRFKHMLSPIKPTGTKIIHEIEGYQTPYVTSKADQQTMDRMLRAICSVKTKLRYLESEILDMKNVVDVCNTASTLHGKDKSHYRVLLPSGNITAIEIKSQIHGENRSSMPSAIVGVEVNKLSYDHKEVWFGCFESKDAYIIEYVQAGITVQEWIENHHPEFYQLLPFNKD